MNRTILIVIVVTLLIVAGLYAGYRLYLPGAVAEALVSQPPAYLPKAIENKFQEWKVPANKGAEDVLKTLEKNAIPLETVVAGIDATTEEQVDAFIQDFNNSKVRNSDELFSLVKKHFDSSEIDIDAFRESFIKNVDPDMVREGIEYYSLNQRKMDIDFDTGKDIVKEILLRKAKERNLIK